MQVCKFSITNINVSLGVSQQRKLGILCLPNTAMQSQGSQCCLLYKIHHFPLYPSMEQSVELLERTSWMCHLCTRPYFVQNSILYKTFLNFRTSDLDRQVTEPRFLSHVHLASNTTVSATYWPHDPGITQQSISLVM